MPDIEKDLEKWLASEVENLPYMSLIAGFCAGWEARDGAVEQLAEVDNAGRLKKALKALWMVKRYYDDERPVDLYQSRRFNALLRAALGIAA